MSKTDTLLKRVEFYEKMASDQKPEAGDLLNKASLYERLALYSDSKSFLKAIAQQPPIMEGETPADPNMRPYAPGSSWEEERQREFGNARTIPKPVPLTPQQEAQQGIAGPPDITLQPDKITGFAPVDRAQQNALGKFVTVEGLTFVDPKKMNDGQLGTETRKALNAFKQWYNSKATGKKITSDNEALQFAKSLVESSPEKYGQ
jgi:hypothetical protein